MNIRRAVIISIMLHIGIMIAKPPTGWMSSKEARAIEVTYSLQNNAPKAALEAPKPITPPKSLPVQTSSPEKLAPPKFVPSPEQQPQKLIPEPPQKETPPPVVQIQLKELVSKQPEISVSSQSASSLPEEEFAVVHHKQLVRKHLKKALSYPAASVQGSVHLALTLDEQGTLKDLAILQSSDMNLATITIEEAQRAQPYPVFPQGMKSAQVRYEFVVQYQQE